MSVRGESLASSPGSARARRLDAHRFRGACVAAVTALTLFVSLGVSTGVTAFADDADVVTPAQTQPAEDEQSTADAKKDDAPADDPVIEEQTAKTPRLVWEARDEDNKFVDGVTFELQGPGDGVATDDDQWKNATKAAVEDNTGQSGYRGLDENPAAGAFLVTQLDDDAAVEEATYRVIPTAPDTLLTGDDAEWTAVKATTSDDDDPAVVTVKAKPADTDDPAAKATGTDDDADPADEDPSAKHTTDPADDEQSANEPKKDDTSDTKAKDDVSEGQKDEDEHSGDSNKSTEKKAEDSSAATESADEELATETAGQPAAQPGVGKAGKAAAVQATSDELTADPGTAVPFGLVGPETGVGTPYIYWEIKSSTPNQLVGGATFRLQGPAANNTNNNSWTGLSIYTVTDCVAASVAACTGYDKDPDAGEFQVPNGATNNGSNPITISNSGNRYWRVQPPATPASWKSADGMSWRWTDTTAIAGQLGTSSTSLNLGNDLAAPDGITWDLRNIQGSALVGGGRFELQGYAVNNTTNGWTAGTVKSYTVTDCTAFPCSGYDSDPTPGVIQVLGGANGLQGTIPALASSQYWRLRPAANPPQWDWSGNKWGFTTSTSAWFNTYQLQSANGSIYRDFGDLLAASAYLAWDVPNSQSAGQLVPGATFNLKENLAGSTTYAVTDCTLEPCTGYDSDPAPGKFKVENGATGPQGTIMISGGTQRWQLQQQQSPTFWQVNGVLYQFASRVNTWRTQASWAVADGGSTYKFESPGSNPSTAARPLDETGSMKVTVRKRVLANPTSVAGTVDLNIGTNYSYTTGAVFRLYTNDGGNLGVPITASWATCTVVASGECTITIPGASGGLQNQRFWVVEEAPLSGSAAASTYANPELYVGDASNSGPADLRRFVGLTKAVTNNTTNYMPMTAATSQTGGTVITDSERPAGSAATIAESGSFGALANSKKNPAIPALCTNLKVAIVVDSSGSITSTNWTNMRNAIAGTGQNSVMSVLQDKASVSILTFSSTARWAYADGTAPVAVTSANRQAIYNSLATQHTGGTNWDDALSTIQAASTKFDLILFVTDGAPNQILNPAQSISYRNWDVTVAIRALEAPIYAANAIKDKGSRIVAVGVGGGAKGDKTGKNLRAVSGEISGSDYVQGDWDKINAMLTDAVKQATCTVPIEVNKTEVVGTTVTPDSPNWVFSASKTGSQGTLVGPNPANGTTTTTAGVTWDLNFTAAGQSAGITLTETNKPDWLLAKVECTVGGIPREVTIVNGSVAITDLGPTSGKVLCTFTNAKVQTGALSVAKAFEGVPSGYGNVSFSGAYTCRARGDLGLDRNLVEDGRRRRGDHRYDVRSRV